MLRHLRALIGLERATEPLVRTFDTLGAVRSLLERDANAGPYIYRGQINRYRARAGRSGMTFEALFPSDYRPAVRNGRLPSDLAAFSQARDIGRDRRDRFMEFLEAEADAGAAGLDWLGEMMRTESMRYAMCYAEALLLPGYSDDFQQWDFATRIAVIELNRKYQLGLASRKTRALWSLAQHYGLATALSDWTHSIDVALWFSTNPWSIDAPAPTNGGYVYRIDLPRLLAILDAYNEVAARDARQRGETPPPDFFVELLDAIPATAALRPANQAGLSVYGLDQLPVLAALFEGRDPIAEIFRFERSEEDSNALTRDHITPSEDPFLAFAERFDAAELG